MPDAPQNHQLAELDSGLRVVTERMPSVRSVALGLWVRTGSRDELVEQAGISHFLEHLLFKGTERFSSEEIDQIFDGMGAEVNAGTSKETTSVYARCLDRHLERSLEVIADMMLAPAYRDVDSERQVVIEEIAMYEDEPSDKVHDVLAGAVFGDHPLGRPIIGSADVVGSVPVPDIAAYHSSRYVGPNLVLASAGAPASRPTARSRSPSMAPRCASTQRTPSSTTWPSAAPASPAATTAASRCACWTPCSGAPAPRGCSRRCARSAAWPTPSTPTPAASRTSGRSASTSAPAATTWGRPWGSSATNCAVCRTSPSPPTSSTG